MCNCCKSWVALDSWVPHGTNHGTDSTLKANKRALTLQQLARDSIAIAAPTGFDGCGYGSSSSSEKSPEELDEEVLEELEVSAAASSTVAFFDNVVLISSVVLNLFSSFGFSSSSYDLLLFSALHYICLYVLNMFFILHFSLCVFTLLMIC